MDTKIQELTEKIYQEGVEKGNEEAARIIAEAEARKKVLIEEAEAKAKEMMVKKDKQRQSYYNYYSSKKWGRADSYDLCINSSVLGVAGSCALLTYLKSVT